MSSIDHKGTIVVPVFNEISCIEKEMRRFLDSGLEREFEIIIVDDGSTDGTSEALEKLSMETGKFILLHHESNKGYGASLKTGIVEASTGHIVIIDADSSYPNSRISELFAIYSEGGYDMVVGARTTASSAVPLIRKPAKLMLNLLANYLTQTRIPDLNSGLRIFRKDIVMDNFNLICSGFSFTTTLTLIMLCNSFSVKYVPIDYYRRAGKSKIHPIRDTLNFFYLILSTVMYFKPLRIFLPPGILLCLIGFVLGIWQAVMIRNVTTVTVIILQTGFYIITISLIADMISKNRIVRHTQHVKRK